RTTEYVIDLGNSISNSSTVNFVAFSPFDQSFDILACGTQDRVYAFRVMLINDNDDANEELKFDYHLMYDYMTGSKATSIAFSPKTDFSQLKDNLLNFAVAGDDFCILILKQLFVDNKALEENSEQQCISGHTDYINDMAFEPI